MGVVLLVEDDEAERYVWRKTVKRFNHEVLLLSTGELALMVLEADSAVAALITDIELGTGMKGTELAKKARALRPDLPILFVTAYPPPGPSLPGPVLVKPYSEESLLTAMRRLFG